MSLLYPFVKKTHYESKINSHVEKLILSKSTRGKKGKPEVLCFNIFKMKWSHVCYLILIHSKIDLSVNKW